MELIIKMDLDESKQVVSTGTLAALLAALTPINEEREALKAGVGSGSSAPAKQTTKTTKTTPPAEKAPEAPAADNGGVFTEMTTTDETGADCPFEGGEKTYTIEDVRARLSVLTKAGKSEDVKAIFAKVGASKLTDVKEADYAKVMEAAAKL